MINGISIGHSYNPFAKNKEKIVKPTGKRVSSLSTLANILSQLPNNGRGCYIVNLRSDDYLKFFTKKGTPVLHVFRGNTGYIYAFEKQ